MARFSFFISSRKTGRSQLGGAQGGWMRLQNIGAPFLPRAEKTHRGQCEISPSKSGSIQQPFQLNHPTHLEETHLPCRSLVNPQCYTTFWKKKKFFSRKKFLYSLSLSRCLGFFVARSSVSEVVWGAFTGRSLSQHLRHHRITLTSFQNVCRRPLRFIMFHH